MIIRNGASLALEEYSRYVICKQMHWDYYTFESQPPFFIEEIVLFMNQEALRDKDEANKMKQASKAKQGGYSRYG